MKISFDDICQPCNGEAPGGCGIPRNPRQRKRTFALQIVVSFLYASKPVNLRTHTEFRSRAKPT